MVVSGLYLVKLECKGVGTHAASGGERHPSAMSGNCTLRFLCHRWESPDRKQKGNSDEGCTHLLDGLYRQLGRELLRLHELIERIRQGLAENSIAIVLV